MWRERFATTTKTLISLLMYMSIEQRKKYRIFTPVLRPRTTKEIPQTKRFTLRLPQATCSWEMHLQAWASSQVLPFVFFSVLFRKISLLRLHYSPFLGKERKNFSRPLKWWCVAFLYQNIYLQEKRVFFNYVPPSNKIVFPKNAYIAKIKKDRSRLVSQINNNIMSFFFTLDTEYIQEIII